MYKHVKFNDNFYLTTQSIGGDVKIVDEIKSVNHLIAIDVSGSLTYELPEIRKNLKNKISNMVKPEDTISIVWFSGKNDAGILKEEVSVNSLKQLNDLNDAIDRWLKPVGMTAFAKPLELASDIIERIRRKNKEAIFSLIFMSDGYNNDIGWGLVVDALNKIAPDLAFSTIVEYGNYADSKRLTEMAAILGGEKISCNGFEEYDVTLNKTLNKNIFSGKKTIVEISSNHLYDFAFTVSNDSVLLYNIVDDKILVGSDTSEIFYFTPIAIGDVNEIGVNTDTSLYAAIYILADKLMNDDAEKIFYALGDQYHYQMLGNAFGKQKLNEFKTAIKDCVNDVNRRYPNGGKSEIKAIDDNAYCLMNLISDLGGIDNCLFYPNHESFNYNRIGRKRVAIGSNLTDADKQKLLEASNVNEATAILKEFSEKKVDLKFIAFNPNLGYPMTDLVWNEERANLSVRIYIEGEVTLPINKYGIDKVPSFKYNTFTLIKDGIVNVTKIPVSYNLDLEKILLAGSVKYDLEYDVENLVPNYIIIDITSIPLINRGMVKIISANELAKKEWALIRLQGDKKVYDYYKKALYPKTSKSFVEMMGQECSDWLKEIGITDFNGFQPKSTSAESTDFYMSVNLATKIKGLSTLPKVEDVVTKIKENKPLKLNEWVMADAITKYFAQLESDIYLSLNEEQQKGILKSYLETKSTILNKQRRKILQEIAETKFSVILSKGWFSEFKSFDENKLTLKLDGHDIEFTFDLKEKEEKI